MAGGCGILIAGPPLSGRSTSLRQLAARFGAAAREVRWNQTHFLEAELVAGAVEPPPGFGTVSLRATPGASHNPPLYRELMSRANGVLFVVDSQQPRLADNVAWLGSWFSGTGREPSQVPLVFQYNKRDLPNAMPVAALRKALNRFGAPEFESIARTGEGVGEALAALLTLCGSHGRITMQ